MVTAINGLNGSSAATASSGSMPYCNMTLEEQISETTHGSDAYGTRADFRNPISVESETSLFGQMTFHGFIGLLAAAGTIVGFAITLYLTCMHVTNYTVPRQQKHIIRILVMVPLYSLSGLYAIREYQHAVIINAIAGIYEAPVICAFFALLYELIAKDFNAQMAYFESLTYMQDFRDPSQDSTFRPFRFCRHQDIKGYDNASAVWPLWFPSRARLDKGGRVIPAGRGVILRLLDRKFTSRKMRKLVALIHAMILEVSERALQPYLDEKIVDGYTFQPLPQQRVVDTMLLKGYSRDAITASLELHDTIESLAIRGATRQESLDALRLDVYTDAHGNPTKPGDVIENTLVPMGFTKDEISLAITLHGLVHSLVLHGGDKTKLVNVIRAIGPSKKTVARIMLSEARNRGQIQPWIVPATFSVRLPRALWWLVRCSLLPWCLPRIFDLHRMRVWRFTLWKSTVPLYGDTWFNMNMAAVFQYILIRWVFQFFLIFSQLAGTFCDSSWSLRFSKIYIISVESISVSITMYCVVQFYDQTAWVLRRHAPLAKLFAVKIVIALTFFQGILIAIFVNMGIFVPDEHIRHPDWLVGIPSLLLCLEMTLFSIMFVYVYSYEDYVRRPDRRDGRIKERELDRDKKGIFMALVDVIWLKDYFWAFLDQGGWVWAWLTTPAMRQRKADFVREIYDAIDPDTPEKPHREPGVLMKQKVPEAIMHTSRAERIEMRRRRRASRPQSRMPSSTEDLPRYTPVFSPVEQTDIGDPSPPAYTEHESERDRNAPLSTMPPSAPPPPIPGDTSSTIACPIETAEEGLPPPTHAPPGPPPRTTPIETVERGLPPPLHAPPVPPRRTTVVEEMDPMDRAAPTRRPPSPPNGAAQEAETGVAIESRPRPPSPPPRPMSRKQSVKTRKAPQASATQAALEPVYNDRTDASLASTPQGPSEDDFEDLAAAPSKEASTTDAAGKEASANHGQLSNEIMAMLDAAIAPSTTSRGAESPSVAHIELEQNDEDDKARRR